MFATHYLIVMIISYKLQTADFLQNTQVFVKATRSSRMMRTMRTKLYALMSSNHHFHKLNVARAECQFSPATSITNTIQCKVYVSQVKSPFILL